MDYPADSSRSDAPSRSQGGSRARRLLDKLRRRKRGRRGAFRSHAAVFASVNAFLAFLNVVTSGLHPWFLYVLGAMAIPLAIHALVTRRRDRLQELLAKTMELPGEPDEIRDLPESIFKPMRKLYRSATGYLIGLTSGAAVSAYLFLINALTGGRFWSIIPAASIAFPLVVWGFFHVGRRRRLRERLEEARQGKGRVELSADVAVEGLDHPALTEARSIRRRIASLVAESATGSAELLSNVDEIIGEIKRLAALDRNIDEARAMFSLSELEQERNALLSRREALGADATTSATVIREYETSLVQVEKHIASLGELEQRHELLRIRLRNGVSSLRQVSLDLVRLRGEQALGELDAKLTAKADELSSYLDDLRKSYAELSELS